MRNTSVTIELARILRVQRYWRNHSITSEWKKFLRVRDWYWRNNRLKETPLSARDTDETIDWKKFRRVREKLTQRQSIERDSCECEGYWRNNRLKEIPYRARDSEVTIDRKTYLGVGLRSSRPKVISPEVMLPKIHSHVARNPKSCRPKFYRVFKLEEK